MSIFKYVRAIAMDALGTYGPSAREAIPKLVSLLKGRGLQHDSALRALNQIDPGWNVDTSIR